MSFFSRFYPDRQVKCAFEITPEWLAEQKIKGVIFDIDNTLVPQDAPADERTVAYFEAIHAAGMKTFFLSNNSKPGRVASFAAATGSGYLCRAKKPGGRGYIKAIRSMRTKRKTTLVVGDQLFTDIFGAKRLRLKAVLVEPVDPTREAASVRVKRPFEKIIFHFWKKENT